MTDKDEKMENTPDNPENTEEEKTPDLENPEEKNPDSEENKEPSKETSEEEKLKAENADLRDKYLRLLAEFDNYRKRSVKERAEIYPEATARAVEAFIPLADNFERAANADCSDEKYKAGIMMIMTQLDNAFKKLGIEEINRAGEQFDPALENAVSQIEDDKLGENTVAQVYQKGYKLGDKVIRHATVVVANCG